MAHVDLRKAARKTLAVSVWALVLTTMACERSPSMVGSQESVFATVDEARIAGAFDAGKLPPFLPGSATEILVRHDDRTGERWLRFALPAEMQEALAEACEPVAQSEVTFPAYRTRGLTWWPELLRGSNDALDEQVTLLRCPPVVGEGPSWMAIHRALPTVWVWQGPNARPAR